MINARDRRARRELVVDRADLELLDDVAKRSGVVSHSVITSHDRDNLWRLAEQLDRCQMHRIERADRFDGKRAADASEHRSVNVEDEAAPLEGSQGSNGRLFICCGQPSSAATSALDSMYRMLAAATLGRCARVAVFRVERRRGALRFATIAVDQCSGSAARQPDVRPVLEWVASFHGGVENAGRDELVPPASWRRAATVPRRHEFGDHPPVGGNRNPLACFNSADVAAQVVFELSDAGLHVMNIATCGHIRNRVGRRRAE